MKKLILFILIFYPVVLFSQPASGDGTSGNPYSGVVTTPWSISGDHYYGELSVTSGTLTIDAGATLRFGTGNSLTITGTGALYAVGNSSSYIKFTASGTSWGHIAFDNPASTSNSSLAYCTIEYGSVSGSGYVGAGGGMLIRHSNVTVSNSIVRNNSSDWGGGIFVDANVHPDISKCLFKDNTTIHGGGAIYCWDGVSSVIDNCIFDSNHCTEPTYSYYSGGAVTAQTNSPIQIINCTFANNTSTQPGDGLLVYFSSGALIINCILWGSTDQIAGATTSQVINCAIEGSTDYTNTVTLTNSGPTGPNFTATDGSDWSIQFASPCRNTGVNSYSGVTIPATDYIGNPTVETKDIGAYEVQYVPTSLKDITSPENTFNIYSNNDFLYIKLLSDNWEGKSGSVKILDLTGKSVADYPNTQFHKNSILQLPNRGTKGFNLVEIRSGAMRYVGKVVIK